MATHNCRFLVPGAKASKGFKTNGFMCAICFTVHICMRTHVFVFACVSASASVRVRVCVFVLRSSH